MERYAVPPVNLYSYRQFLAWVLMQKMYSAREVAKNNLK
jgi:hypothetical protein